MCEQAPDVYPRLELAELVIPPTHLQCGACGFSGPILYVYYTDAPWCFEPVCNCAIAAVLYA